MTRERESSDELPRVQDHPHRRSTDTDKIVKRIPWEIITICLIIIGALVGVIWAGVSNQIHDLDQAQRAVDKRTTTLEERSAAIKETLDEHRKILNSILTEVRKPK